MSYKLRMWVSLTLFALWLITGITGIILLIAPLAAQFGLTLPVSLADTLHTYLGFAFFGLSFVHIALNWSAMKAYFRKLRS
ncbi:hypothetical protein Plut_1211 [Thermococcus onnurineus NA1]|uniref:Flavinylation-associated cytochrome domain-containing protein n=1 Tax=Thermococcus onnurineus (strain NA1) TaxID=523850 RepID=B6YT92_THEON|nr:DUF4405 domain-containing protein [Thermococcus onnurineus]ACJ15779.1 hypothetical protein Plut_1211 [Thermococcus onnurineus NA1]